MPELLKNVHEVTSPPELRNLIVVFEFESKKLKSTEIEENMILFGDL